MKPRLIVIDGKTYNGVDEMPVGVRSRYQQALSAFRDQDGNRVPGVLEQNIMLADSNHNGTPDFMEGMTGIRPTGTPVTTGPPQDSRRQPPRKPMPVTPVLTPGTSSGWMLLLLGARMIILCAAAGGGLWYFLLR